MIWIKLIIMCLFLWNKIFCDVQTISDYLKNKLIYTNNVMEDFNQQLVTSPFEITVTFETNKMASIPNYYVTANTFTLFNKTHIFLNSTLYTLEKNLKNFVLKESDSFLKENQQISFIEIIEYDKIGIIFIALSNVSSVIYGYSSIKNEYFFIQSVSNEKFSNAKFFKNRNNLYLIATNDNTNNVTSTTIYKWTHYHFDRIENIVTRDTIKMVSFNCEDSQIIILLQKSNFNQNQYLAVYKFSDDKLQKIQLITVNSPTYVTTYKNQNKNFLVVFEKLQNSRLYFWNGVEFVLWMDLDSYPNVTKQLTNYVNSNPIIFILNKNKLLTFSHFLNNLRLIQITELKENYEKILDMQLISYNNKHSLFIITLNNRKINYMTMEFTLNRLNIDAPVLEESNHLRECLNHLQNILLNNTQKIDSVNEIKKSSRQINEPHQHHYSSVNEPVLAQPVPVNSVSDITTGIIQPEFHKLQSQLSLLTNQINFLNPRLATLYHEGDMINGNIIIKGDLRGQQLLAASNLKIKFLNGKLWNPKSWLLRSKVQNITGKVFIKNLSTQNLNLPPNNKLFHDFSKFIVNEDEIIEVNSLTANTIFTKDINNIPIKDLYLKSSPVTISGFKNFQRLSVGSMQATYLNEKGATLFINNAVNSNVGLSKSKITANLKLKSLNFEQINGIDWNVFKSSLFRKGIDQNIQGILTAQTIESNRINAKTVANLNVSSLLTLTTDQTVKSKINFEVVTVSNISCETLNGIDFNREVATEKNSYIKGPVSFDHVTVMGTLSGPTNKLKLDATKEDNFLQIYKNVKIVGNLYVSNLKLLNSAVAVVNNENFNLKQIYEYWLKDQNQVIRDHFEAHEGISVPHLATRNVNSVDVKQFLRNEKENKLKTNLFFENVTIIGNVNLNPNAIHNPNVKNLNLEAVRLKGRFSIFGRKTLQGKITVGNLVTNYLDDIKLSDALNINNLNKISGITTFQNILIEGNLNSNAITTKAINDVDLNALNKLAMFTNKPQIIEELIVENISTRTIETSLINNVSYNDYLSHFNNINSLEILKNLIVNGNVQFLNVQGISHINDIPINELFMAKVENNGNMNSRATIKFLGNVYAKNVEVIFINNVNVSNLNQKLLYRNMEQNVTAKYSFDVLTTTNILTSRINNIETSNLIDIKEMTVQTVVVPGGLKLMEAEFLRSFYSESLICNVEEAISRIHNQPTRFWNTLSVFQNVTLLNQECDLTTILEKSVNLKKTNVIQGQVIFEHNILGSYVSLGTVNEINFDEFIQDAVLATATEQIVTGHKTFDRLITSTANIMGSAEIPIINKIDIKKVNSSIVFKNGADQWVINGSKIFFAGLEANRLISPKLTNVDPEVLITTKSTTIPKAYFNNLEIVDNFNVDYVNDINVSDVLSKRILLNSNNEQLALGVYYFDNLVIIGNCTVNKMNELTMSDVVFDLGKQIIINSKKFTQSTNINGNIYFRNLNSVDMVNGYNSSMFQDQPKTSKNIVFKDHTVILSNISTDYLNGFSVNFLKNLIESKVEAKYSKFIQDKASKIESVLNTSLEISHGAGNTYLYLEKSKDLQFYLKNVTEASISAFKNNIVLEAVVLEVGSQCGYTNDCNCFTQKKMQISRELSINVITQVTNKLIFGYEDEEFTLHWFSERPNDRNVCGTSSNASISFMWMVRYPKESQGSHLYSDYVMGYMKKVEFYRLDTYVYVVTNIESNNNRLDCLIYKFDNRKKIVSLVQIINDRILEGILETPKGMHLILTGGKNSKIVTQIYNFNATVEKFTLFQEIFSFNPPIIKTMVIDLAPSFAFALRKKPLKIYKYNLYKDKYVIDSKIHHFNFKPIGISAIYLGDLESRTTYLSVVVEGGNFYIYSLTTHEVKSKGKIDGLQMLLPFVLNGKNYLFAVSTNLSYVLSIIQQGV